MHPQILIVDDSRLVRARYRSLLEQHGYMVCCAADGHSALAVVEANPELVLVVTDLHMPRMDGRALVSAIRTLPGRQLLPVLMLTSSERKDDLLANLQAGVSDFVNKGGDVTEFLARVANLARIGALQHELERVSRTDGLTGLANRRHASSCLRIAVNASTREAQPLSVCLLDVDHFKRFNDTWGHETGDQVLIEVAKAVAEAARRPTDVVARWGGEEFLVILPGCPLHEATARIEQVRNALGHRDLHDTSGKHRLRVTISGGIAQLRASDTPESVVDRADDGMYRAKQSGRNRLCVEETELRLAA